MTEVVVEEHIKHVCDGCNRTYSSKWAMNRHRKNKNCRKKRGRKPKVKQIEDTVSYKKRGPKAKNHVTEEIINKQNEEINMTTYPTDPTDTIDSIDLIEIPVIGQVEQSKDEVDCDVISLKNDSLVKEYSTKLKDNNKALEQINESIQRLEYDIRNTLADKYTISRLKDALAIEIAKEIKLSNIYLENQNLIDNCISLFEPQPSSNYNIEDIIAKLIENRMDILMLKFDNIKCLKRNKLDLLSDNFKISAKIIELLKS